jgi:hypothetical protein
VVYKLVRMHRAVIDDGLRQETDDDRERPAPDAGFG